MQNIFEQIKTKMPNGIKYMTLSEIGKICMCKRILKSQTSEEYDIPFYKIGTFGNQPDTYIQRELFEQYKNKYSYPKKGDVLISCSGTIGKSVIFDGKDSYFQDSNIVWIDNDEKIILNKFLYYYYQISPWKVSKGGTINRLYNKNLEKTLVPVLPIEMQNLIIDALEKLENSKDVLISNLNAELAKRFDQYIFNSEKIIKSCKYNIVKLKEIADVYDGTHSTPDYKDNGVPFISVENIDDIYNSNKFISNEDFDKYKIKPMINDIFMTRIGSIGKCAVLNKKIDIAYYVSLALIRPKSNNIDSNFIKYYFESSIGRKELYKKTLIHAVPIKINKDSIGEVLVYLPPLNEQQKIAIKLNILSTSYNNLIEKINEEIIVRKKQYEYYKKKILCFLEETDE